MNMNKKKFLKTLKYYMKKLKSTEVKKQISYYEELLSDMTENGLSEEEAVKKLGSPQDIAMEILRNAASEDYKKKDTIGTILLTSSLILLALSLLLLIITNFPVSFSVIGGADGPTSVFIAGKIAPPQWPYYLTGCCVCITIIYKILRR